MGMPMITPGTTTVCQAITDMIESVALEQAALSHILNAEGEKIQTIIAGSSSINQLIAVNKSAQSMVGIITRLEMMLLAQLELFRDAPCTDAPQP